MSRQLLLVCSIVKGFNKFPPGAKFLESIPPRRDRPSRSEDEASCFGSILTSFSAWPGQTALWSASQAEHVSAKRYELEEAMQRPLFQDLHLKVAEQYQQVLEGRQTSPDVHELRHQWHENYSWKLNVHGWPVGEPRSCCMFVKRYHSWATHNH